MADIYGTPVVAQTAALYVQDPVTKLWYLVSGLTNWSGPQTSVEELDATNLSDVARRSLPGLPDYGSLSGTAQTMLGTPGQWLLSKSLENNPPDTFRFKLRLPDDGAGNGEVWGYGKGFVNGFPIEGSVGAVITSAISIRLTGPWNWERPTEADRKLIWSATTMSGSAAGNGAVLGSLNVTLSGDTFVGATGDALAGVAFAGTPTGLTPKVTLLSPTVARIQFTGTAADPNEGTTDVVTITFDDSAFTGGNAAEVVGYERSININW